MRCMVRGRLVRRQSSMLVSNRATGARWMQTVAAIASGICAASSRTSWRDGAASPKPFDRCGGGNAAAMGSGRRVETELETRVQTLRKLERQIAQRDDTPVGHLAAIRSLLMEAEAELKLARSTD
jgi:hypothetical protein